MLSIMVVPLLLVAALDVSAFGNLDRISGFLDRSRLVVAETVFGLLTAALAVELVIRGLAELGVSGLAVHEPLSCSGCSLNQSFKFRQSALRSVEQGQWGVVLAEKHHPDKFPPIARG